MEDKAITGFLGTNPLIGMDPIIAYPRVHNIEGNKALVYPIDASFSEDTKCQIAEKLELVIAHHLGCLEVTFTTPTAILGFESRNNDNRRPWCYLLCDISGENLQTLLADGFIANQHASLHIIPFDPPPATTLDASATSPSYLDYVARSTRSYETRSVKTLPSKPSSTPFSLPIMTLSHEPFSSKAMCANGSLALREPSTSKARNNPARLSPTGTGTSNPPRRT